MRSIYPSRYRLATINKDDIIADIALAPLRISSTEEIHRRERDRQLNGQPRDSSAEEIQDQGSQT